MSAGPRPRWRPLVFWGVLGIPLTIWLFLIQQAQAIDPSNTALEVPGTADAMNLRRLAQVGITERVILLGFRPIGDLPPLTFDLDLIEDCVDELNDLPGVDRCERLREADANLTLLEVLLDDDAPSTLPAEIISFAERKCPTAMRLLVTGIPVYEARIAERVAAERRSIVPAIGGALFLAAWFLYRRFALALATLAPAMIAIVWTGGLSAALGHRLDPVAALLDPVLLTIGVATSIHFVEGWRRCAAAGHDSHQSGVLAGRQLRLPTTLATVTTMAGLLSLSLSPVPAIVDFGLRAAFGVALLHFSVFTWFPAILAVLRPPAPSRPAPSSNGSWGNAWVAALTRRRGLLTVATVAITALATAGLPRLHADNDPLRMLPPDDARRLDHEELARRLGGAEIFHVYAPPRSPATEPDRMLPFLAAAQTMPGIAGPGGPPLRGREGDVAVPLLLRPAGSALRHRLFDDIDRAAELCGLDGLVAAGPAVQMARDSHDLIVGLAAGTTLVFFLLAAGVCVGLRSLWLGLCGSVPMAMSCLVIYGGIGWIDRPVSVAIAMIGCTMLGLVVDNVLHLLHHYRNFRVTLPSSRALALALNHSGRPIWVASAMLLLGFLTTATSRLTTTVEFALLAVSTIAVALFGTVVAVPLLLLDDGLPAAESRRAM